MAQVFKINGTTINYVTFADWGEAIVDEDLNGQTIRNRWRGHIWQAQGMTAAEYDTIYALEGQKVTLTTTNYSNRNAAYKTYYEVTLRHIEARHPGFLRQDVTVEFMVRT